MRQGIVLGLLTLMLAGCAPRAATTPAPDAQTGSPVASVEASLGADVPPNQPSLERADEAGLSPDESVLALVDALNQTAWQTAYSSYASAPVDFTTAAREWADAHETYMDFRVLEVRINSGDSAFVRVAYAVTRDPFSSAIPPVVVDEPGEWWAIYKVDGLWKTQWMPRQ